MAASGAYFSHLRLLMLRSVRSLQPHLPMKTCRINSFLNTTLYILTGVLSIMGLSARAELPPIMPGEDILLAEDFADNRNAWVGVGATDTASPGIVNQARIANSDWSPSLPSVDSIKSTVESFHVFSKPIDLTNGSISIYLSARVDKPKGGDGSRFSVSIQEAKRASFASMSIRPGLNTYLEYRDEIGKIVPAKLSGVRFAEGVYCRFKLTLSASWNMTDYLGRLEAFVYDETARKYISLGFADDSIVFKTGKFEQIALLSRNGPDGFVYIDSIVVAQNKH